jgi:threonine aldolase
MAELFGKEKAILLPTGTMANIVGLMVHCRSKGDAAIIGHLTHINNWERGNIAGIGGIMP